MEGIVLPILVGAVEQEVKELPKPEVQPEVKEPVAKKVKGTLV